MRPASRGFRVINAPQHERPIHILDVERESLHIRNRAARRPKIHDGPEVGRRIFPHRLTDFFHHQGLSQFPGEGIEHPHVRRSVVSFFGKCPQPRHQRSGSGAHRQQDEKDDAVGPILYGKGKRRIHKDVHKGCRGQQSHQSRRSPPVAKRRRHDGN